MVKSQYSCVPAKALFFSFASGELYISRHIAPIENSVTIVTKRELHGFSKRMAEDGERPGQSQCGRNSARRSTFALAQQLLGPVRDGAKFAGISRSQRTSRESPSGKDAVRTLQKFLYFFGSRFCFARRFEVLNLRRTRTA